ncbi:hypothetical protein F5146DRAFT_895390, partial [Armillaria mellea]
WQGKLMTELATDDVHEILWELSELDFRPEFLSLNMHLRLIEGDSALKKHKIHVGHCFPQGQYNQCWIAQLPDAHHGLAESSWIRQAPFICLLHHVISTWRGCLESIWVEKNRYTEDMLVCLLQQMTLFYCQSFHQAFGQAPTLP